MSYILEALRRAETERERKRRVPGLHAQPVVVPPEEPGTQRSKAWLWVVVGVSAGVLLPLLWRSWPSDPAAEEAANARVAVAGSVAPRGAAATDAPAAPPAATAPPAAEPAATKPAPAGAPARPAEPTPAKPGAARTQPERAARPPTTAAATLATATRGAAPSQGAMPTPANAPTQASASAPEPRLRSLAELPEELRRGVPPLAFGGSVYSDTAAQRMVIFNGQVLREGDAVTDDLLLEQIRPRSAVMRLRGQRFEVAF